jgi:hypothetical protein
MSSILKGNFQTKRNVEIEVDPAATESVEARFEREALKRLGGSIAFVAKRKVLWDVPDDGAEAAPSQQQEEEKKQP